MNEELMGKVAEDLIALKNQDDKIFVPRNRNEALEFIRDHAYGLKNTFSSDDPELIEAARRLARRHRKVIVLPNPPESYEIYVPSDEDRSVQSQKKSGCFIATAAYGSPLAPEVIIFRRFRDGVLLNSKLGSSLVEIYYFVSPPLASLISRTNLLKKMIRYLVLAPLLRVVKTVIRLNPQLQRKKMRE